MTLPVVLFDLDGTLTDSAAGIVASYRHTLSQFGLSADEASVRRCIGPPLEHSLGTLGVPFETLEAAVAVFRECFTRSGMFNNRVYEGIPEVLTALSAAGTTLGLATSKLTEPALAILEHFDLYGFFTTVSGATADGRRLYKIDVVTHALESLGSPAASTVALVGDREHDMYAARQLGLYAVGVSWGYGDRAELLGSGAQVIVDEPAQLIELLLGQQEGAA